MPKIMSKNFVYYRLPAFRSVKKFLSERLIFIDAKNLNTPEELKSLSLDRICVCDFYVRGCESGEVHDSHLIFKDIQIIDHHASLDRYQKKVSSTNLAIDYVRKFGPTDRKIVLNHADCDSVLSMLVMLGVLPPDERFGAAAIAADHTGDRDEIADLLMALDPLRDVFLSVRELFKLLRGKSLSLTSGRLLLNRRLSRRRLKCLVKKGSFRFCDGVAYIILKKKIEGELAPAVLPGARAILLATRMDNGRWQIKVRLGIKTKANLSKLDIPDFGGRWNAGSTKRSGGTSLHPSEYARIVSEKLKKSGV